MLNALSSLNAHYGDRSPDSCQIAKSFGVRRDDRQGQIIWEVKFLILSQDLLGVLVQVDGKPVIRLLRRDIHRIAKPSNKIMERSPPLFIQ